MTFRFMAIALIAMLRGGMQVSADLTKFANTRTRRLGVLAVLVFLLDVVSLGRVNGWLVAGLVLAALTSWAFDHWRR